MKSVSLADAKARLSELVQSAIDGETVEITRRGKPVAHLIAADRPRKRIDAEFLKGITDSMKMQTQSAAELVRQMRDSDRY